MRNISRYCLAVCALNLAFLAHRAAAQIRPDTTVIGSAQLIAIQVKDPNGTMYDLVQLTGSRADIRPATGRAVRVQFIDPNDDIVLVEILGDATVTFAFESAVFPTAATKYNSPALYTKGLVSLAVTNPDASSSLAIWTLGPYTSPNAQLFRGDVTYDGIADIQRISIAAPAAAQYGAIRAANARFGGSTGSVGISATNIELLGPVMINDVDASGSAVPVLSFGNATGGLTVAGGDLSQSNGALVSIEGVSALVFSSGTTSHGLTIPAKSPACELELVNKATPEPELVVSGFSLTFVTGVPGEHSVRIGPGGYSISNSSNFPAWATLTNGVISGTPPSSAGSPFEFDVSLSQGVNRIVSRVTLTVTGPPPAAPSFSLHPLTSIVSVGGTVALSAAASGTPDPVYQWRRNGATIVGATQSTLQLGPATPEHAGLYTVVASNDAGSIESEAAFVGVRAATKVAGIAEELASDIQHPNGNVFDQVLLKGPYASIKAEGGKVTRMSFTDPNHDILQLEFSGSGTVSVWLEDATPEAPPVNYVQNVKYVGGHARIVITDADHTSNLSVFSVGKANAVNQALFRDDVEYDGVADVISVSISSVDGEFGGLRMANAAFVGTAGVVGIYAPNVAFKGPVFVGNIVASDEANPSLILGSASDVRITGGDLLQPNNRAVAIKGVTALQFRNGSTSHGDLFLAQANRGKLEHDGVDVTAQVAQTPQP